MREAMTHGIRIIVNSEYVPEKSNPQLDYYFFMYHIRIVNESEDTIQLISRHWIIEDGEQKLQEVQGSGVVGKQPVIHPGESFDYNSFCPLPTPMGKMRGSYQMKHESGEFFEVLIPEFLLQNSHTLH